MEKNKIIVILLILAILFSFVSVIVNIVTSNINFNRPSLSDKVLKDSSKGGLEVYVEGNNIHNEK